MSNIEHARFWEGRETPNYFHPAVCNTADGKLMMTLQLHSGVSDTYGDPEFTISQDGGVSWPSPEPITALETIRVSETTAEAVSDIRPVYHPLTKSVLVTGVVAFYSEDKCVTADKDFDANRYRQCPVYAVYRSDGTWSKKRKLLPESFLKDSFDWRTACAQVLVLPDGDLILPIYFKPNQAKLYSVCTVRCSFDGEEMAIKEVGPMLSTDAGRGFLEPSVIDKSGTFYLTIRAEDNKGYWAESSDGLNWVNLKPWKWDNGDELKTSTTQQHWLKIQDKLYLVYTREDKSNKDVIRWRAPLFMAEVDLEENCLLRETEQIVLPLEFRDGEPNLMGNFNVFNMSETTSIVTDAPTWFKIVKGERVEDDYLDDVRTDVWIATIKSP